jgi:hypothetical protein
MDLDQIEKLFKVLILFFILIIIIIVVVKLNQTWGVISGWKKSLLCWAFGGNFC